MPYPNTDWFKEVLKNNSLQQKHNISIRGGNDRVKDFIGGGYSNQDAIYKESNTYYNLYNIRSNIDAQITKSLKKSAEEGSGYDPKNPYQRRDPRFYASILYNGAMYRGRPVEVFIPKGKDSSQGNIGSWNTSLTGYYLYKFMDEIYFLFHVAKS